MRLVEACNTVVVIEHNLDVIKVADQIIDLGPEGGEEGGRVIATGTPEQVATVTGSHTGEFLAEVLTARATKTTKTTKTAKTARSPASNGGPAPNVAKTAKDAATNGRPAPNVAKTAKDAATNGRPA